MMIDLVRDALPGFAARDAAEPEVYPSRSVTDLYAMGVVQSPFPAELGGIGGSPAQSVEIVEALAGASGSLALIASMPLGLANIFAIDDVYIPAAFRDDWHTQVRIAAAEYREAKVYAACNSEKGAGGSLASIKTTARRDADGHFRLEGEKILATSGKHATRFFSTAKVSQEDLPGAGVVEFFLLPAHGDGVEILEDWDGFGMRPTESQGVRYHDARADGLLGFPNFLAEVQPLQHFFLIFAAIPLGCAGAILRELTTPSPQSPALRLRFNEALMRYESLRAYLFETANALQWAAQPALRSRVLRTKTYVSQESTKLAAELFALSGGRSYRRTGTVARAFSDAFAGTALRPPLALGLEMLSESFSMDPDPASD